MASSAMLLLAAADGLQSEFDLLAIIAAQSELLPPWLDTLSRGFYGGRSARCFHLRNPALCLSG
jgi:hypothetical protein